MVVPYFSKSLFLTISTPGEPTSFLIIETMVFSQSSDFFLSKFDLLALYSFNNFTVEILVKFVYYFQFWNQLKQF